MRKKLLAMIEVAAVLAGLVVIGSCGAVSFGEGGLGGIAYLLGILVVTVVCVGGVFVVTRMSADIMAIRRRLENETAQSPDGGNADASNPKAGNPEESNPEGIPVESGQDEKTPP